MKKSIAFLLAFALVLSMTACRETKPLDVTTQPTEAATEPATEPTEESTEPEIVAAFDDYVYIHEEQRDRDWEEDIVYLAQMYLGEGPVKGHAAIVNKWYSVQDIDGYITTRYFYDADLRDTFIEEIHTLIGKVPELTDDQIIYGLQAIVALLRDAHTSVTLPVGEFFPYVVQQMEHEGELGLYVTRIPKEHSDLLYAELTAINGIDIQEVRERLGRYVSAENEYWEDHLVYSLYYNGKIMDKTALQAAGVVDTEEDTAMFRFLTLNGEKVEVELEALALGDEYWRVGYVDCTPYALGMLNMSQYGDTKYFGTHLSEYDTYYIRLYNMQSESENPLEQFLWDQTGEIKRVGGVKKLVIDVRLNPGGYGNFADDMIEYLKESGVEEVYILMDEGSCSAAVWFPHRAREKLENVVLVGTPAGQPPNFFAGSSSVYELRKHDVYFTISATFSEMGKGFEGDAVEPDILVYQDLEDYMNGIDTQLQTVLEMEAPQGE